MNYRALLIDLLDLPEDATDETVAATLEETQHLINTMEPAEKELLELRNRVQQMEEEQMEQDLAGLSPVARNIWKPLLLKNRADAITALHQWKNRTPHEAALHQTSKARVPEIFSHSRRPEEQTLLVNRIRENRKCTYQQAWEEAKRTHPELFSTPSLNP